MNSYYKLTVEFACPSCRKQSRLDSVIESPSSNPDEAAQAAGTLPLKCAACQQTASAGTGIHVNAIPISAVQYIEWVATHRDSLHVYTQREPN
jgi:hypothetical protein